MGEIQINANVSGDPKGDVPFILSDSGIEYPGVFDPANAGRISFALPVTSPPNGWGAYLRWTALDSNGFTTQSVRCAIGIGDPTKPTPLTAGAWEGGLLAVPLPTIAYAPPIPAPPTRADLLGLRMHFRGGLVVPSSTYGNMPWWPAALPWCDPATRQAAYAVMREAKDRHALVGIPNGQPLYNEGNQFYSPDKFGALDWTNGETALDTRFDDLLIEVLESGFLALIAMDERPDHSRRIVKLVMERLALLGLEEYALTMPGFDGVYWGWPEPEISGWATDARAIAPNARLAIEFNKGALPPEVAFYRGGLLDGFDLICGEFDSFIPDNGSAGSQVWQIVGRCVRPYHKPADQNDGDANPPPFYLIDSPRGPRTFCFLETDWPYHWVRTDVNNPAALAYAQNAIQGETGYVQRLGCAYVG